MNQIVYNNDKKSKKKKIQKINENTGILVEDATEEDSGVRNDNRKENDNERPHRKNIGV